MKINKKTGFLRPVKSALAFAAIAFTCGSTHAQDFPEPYCDVAFDYTVEPITLVQFAGIDNTTDAEVDGTPALEDFTDITGEVSPGSSYLMTLDGNTDGSWNDYFYVYADWNQDGDFDDAGEAYAAGGIYDSEGDGTAPAVSTITVPLSALSGETRMRVLKVYDESEDPGPCLELYDYGQAEDYTLNVAELTCDLPVASYTIVPDCASGEFSVDVNLTDLGDASTVDLMEGADVLTTFSAAGTFTAGPFASGSLHAFTLVSGDDAGCFIIAPAQTYICPPANDECSGAIALTVNPDLSCGTVTSGTTADATGSLEGCGGDPGDDVWYSFEATATQHNVSLTNIVGAYEDLVFEVFDGCGGTSLFCSDPEEATVTGLTEGDTYYIRVYTWDEVETATFDICIGTLPDPPANDECSGAISLTVNSGLSCDDVTAGSTAGATGSLEGCSGTADDDVWYSFEATGEGHTISLNDIEGSSDDLMFEVFDGCGGTGLLCSDPESATVTGLTVGDIYYIRVYTYYDADYASFNICVASIPTGGSCGDPLIVDGLPYSTDDNTANYGNYYEGSPGAACSDNDYLDGDDAVYAYTPETSGYINVELIPADEWAGIFIYTSCDDIGESCVAGGMNESTMDTINIDDFAVTGGTTYYFVISTWPSPQSTEYTFNITESIITVSGIDAATQDDVPAEITVDDGTLQMVAAITPAEADQSVTWSVVPGTGSATISTTGMVTALTNGTVWAKAVSVADAAFADSVEITITNQVQPVASVGVSVLDGDAPEINIPSGTLQMVATVLPADADPAVSWSIIPGTGAAAISAAGLVTASANGTVWAKAVSVADASKSDSLMITITNQDLGVEAVANALGLSIHPNPGRDAVYLSVQKEHPALSVSVSDINGRLISNREIGVNGLNTPFKLDISDLAGGVYMIRLSGQGIDVTRKLIKN